MCKKLFEIRRVSTCVALNAILAICMQRAPAQTATPADQPTTPQTHSNSAGEVSSRFGMGIELSSIGLGAEAGVAISQRSNLRAGFSVLGFSHTFTKDGIPYEGHLNFKTVDVRYDFFPWFGNFHISPGILFYLDDPIKGSANVPANRSFTIGGTTFYSDPARPTTATGTITFNQIAPTITVGWGNLIPRKEGSRFSFPFEIGVAFQGRPNTNLAFGGGACLTPGTNCSSAAASPELQRNIASEEKKIDNNLSFLRIYPIISSGFSVRF